MSERFPRRMSAELIGKLRNLAERQRAYVLDLQETGRWKHYYSANEFDAFRRDTIRLAETWARMADPVAE